MAYSNYSFSINDWAFGPDAGSLTTSGQSFAYTYGMGWGLTQVDGLKTLPDVRSADTPKPYAHGTYAGADRYEGRLITLSLKLTDAWYRTEQEFADYMRAMEVATQVSDTAQKILFKVPGWNHTGSLDSSTVRLFGRVRRRAVGMTVDEYGIQAPAAEIDLYCNDPYIYSAVNTVVDFLTPSTTAGRVYPMDYPVSYGGASSVTSAVLSNYGSIKALPVVDFYGPCTNPYINNLDTGESFKLGMTIADGDYVRCDFANQTVLLNGITNRRNMVTTAQFWGILPINAFSSTYASQGDTVVFGYSSGSAPAHAVVTFASTWM